MLATNSTDSPLRVLLDSTERTMILEGIHNLEAILAQDDRPCIIFREKTRVDDAGSYVRIHDGQGCSSDVSITIMMTIHLTIRVFQLGMLPSKTMGQSIILQRPNCLDPLLITYHLTRTLGKYSPHSSNSHHTNYRAS